MPIVAVIPARGGSKGLPGKNLLKIGGIPLLARTIRAAKDSSFINSTYVTSDAHDLLELAQREGALPIQRPADLASDAASSEAALLHALNFLAEQEIFPEVFVFLQCTSPFTRGDQIDQVVQALLKSESAMAFSATPWHGFLWRTNAQGWGEGVNHDADTPRPRRQDLPPCWLESGAIYAIRRKEFELTGNRFVTPRLPVPIEGWAPEIDTLADFEICEQMATILDRPTNQDPDNA